MQLCATGAEAEAAAAARAASLGRAASSAAVQVGQNEDSAHWRGQRKHFFVLSNAGTKPPPCSTSVPLAMQMPML